MDTAFTTSKFADRDNWGSLVEGRSGCRIELIERDGFVFVRKSAKDEKYSTRLVRQAQKQAAFANWVSGNSFQVPKVYDLSVGNELERGFVEMEFVRAEKYSDFLGTASKEKLTFFTRSIINYLDELVGRSRPIKIRPEILSDKLCQVTDVINFESVNRKISDLARIFLCSPPDDTILMGRCHGDFTLSNMLFRGNRVYLIDFLDSFIETPCQDVVKLRQDTYYHWSLMLEPSLPKHQHDRVLQTLQFIDEKVQIWLKQHPSIYAWYDYLQVFNLYRILPYVSAPHEILFVEQSLQRQLSHAANHSDGR